MQSRWPIDCNARSGLREGVSMAVKVLDRPKTRRLSRLRMRRNVEGWLFIAPVVFGIIAFQFFPIIVSMYASLTQWDGMNPPQFSGMNNYITLFTSDPFFRITLRNTILFTIGNIPCSIGLALCLALLCSRKMRGIALFRTAYFTPYITSVVSII